MKKQNQISKKLDEEEKRRFLENYKWFSKFSPVEKLIIAKRAAKFSEILKKNNMKGKDIDDIKLLEEIRGISQKRHKV